MIDRYLYSLDSLFSIQTDYGKREILNQNDREKMSEEIKKKRTKLFQSIEALGINVGEKRLISNEHNFSLAITVREEPFRRDSNKEYCISLIADNIEPDSCPPFRDSFRTVDLATIGVGKKKKDIYFERALGSASNNVSFEDVLEVVEGFLAQEIQPRGSQV